MVRWRGFAWTQGLALAAILMVAALLRLWQIDQIPPGFHFDESFEGLEAWRILTNSSYRPIFLEGNFGVPPFNAYANALTFAVAEWIGATRVGVGAGPTAMRVTAAIFGVLGVWAVFAVAQEMRHRSPALFSPLMPWLAAATLAGMRWHLHFSRMGIEPVIVPLCWAVATWLLLRAWRTRAWWAWGALGVVLATSMYVYQGAWVIPPLIALTALHLLWADRHERTHQKPRWGGLIVAAVIAIVGILPLVLFFVRQPDLLIMRPAQIAIVGQTDSPADSTIGDALWATAKMFGPFGSPGDLDPRRNIPGAPALNFWQAIPFYLGLIVALWHFFRSKERVTMALPLIGLVGLLLPGVISEYAPHFHRILGAAAPVALLVGLGLDFAWQRVNRLHLPALRLVGAGGLGLLIALGVVVSARDYFVRWATLPDLFYAFDAGLWDLGQWVAEQPRENTIYISPQGENHATLAFAWREQPNRDIPAPAPIQYDGRYVLPLVAGANESPEAYAVIAHEDFRSGLLLPGVFSPLETTYQILDPAGQTYAQVYTRPTDTLPMRTPQIPLAAALGDGIALVGYDRLPEEARAGASLYLQYHWQVDAIPTVDWTVYNHLLDSEGNQVAGFDNQPGRGSLVTTRWQAGWRVLDEYEIVLPVDLPPGDYTLRMGLYDANGNTLPAGGAGVELGLVSIVE